MAGFQVNGTRKTGQKRKRPLMQDTNRIRGCFVLSVQTGAVHCRVVSLFLTCTATSGSSVMIPRPHCTH